MATRGLKTIANFRDHLITASAGKVILMLRTTGPDGIDAAEKANQVYSAYYLNFQSEAPGIFDKVLYNEFVFLEFDTEENAITFVTENLPGVKPSDADYFIQYVLYNDGMYVRGNDGHNGLREPRPDE